MVDLKRQNRLNVGTAKPKQKIKMQSVSDDDVRKRLLEAGGERCIHSHTGKMLHPPAGRSRALNCSNWESTATDG